MRAFIGMALLAMAAACFADDQGQAIQRALIQRDQQSAEFAAQVRGQDVGRLQQLHANQQRDASLPVNPDPQINQQMQPYQRERMAQERELVFPPPVVLNSKPAEPPAPPQPLPLPGGPRHVVDPIPPQSLPN
jgi:hypothetical protein